MNDLLVCIYGMNVILDFRSYIIFIRTAKFIRNVFSYPVRIPFFEVFLL